MAETPAANGAAGDELHVVGIYSDNWGDSYKGAHPLLVVHCSREDAEALKDAFATVEPTTCCDFRYPTVDRWDAMAPLTRAAAKAVAGRYSLASASLDVDGVPWRGGEVAANVGRRAVARAAGLNVELFDLHLATRDLARAGGLKIDDGRDGTTAPAKLASIAFPSSASPPASLQTPSSLRPLAGEPGQNVDDADVVTFCLMSSPVPAEPATIDHGPVPPDIWATYPEAGDVDARCTSGHYIAVEYDVGGMVFTPKRRWLARSPVRRVLERLADVLRVAFPPMWRGSTPAFVVVRGDALSDAQRFLIDDEFGGQTHTQCLFGDEGTIDEVASRVPGWLERFEKEERAADEEYAGELNAERDAAATLAESRDERRRADPIRVIDAALDAMVELRDVINSHRNRINGAPKIAEAHHRFAAAAGDVLHAHDAQGTFDPLLCQLPNVWRAAGAAGKWTDHGSDGWAVRERAADELTDLRRDVLIGRGRDRETAEAAPTLPSVADAVLTPATILDVLRQMPDVEQQAVFDGVKALAAARSRSDALATTELRPDPAERDVPASLTTQQRIILAIEQKQREPGQTAKFIAESVGLAASTLSQSPLWQAAKKRVEESAANAPADGFRRDDGSLEAGEDAA